MRFVEIFGGWTAPVSNEEHLIIDKFESQPVLKEEDLDEREQELCRLLTSRGVLNRKETESGKLRYTRNILSEIWRD